MPFDRDAFLSEGKEFDRDAFLSEGKEGAGAQAEGAPEDMLRETFIPGIPREVVNRAGEAFMGQARIAGRLLTPQDYKSEGPLGALRALKETGESALAIPGMVTAPIASLVAEDLATAKLKAGEWTAKGVEYFSPEKAARIREGLPKTQEEAYKQELPNAELLLSAFGPARGPAGKVLSVPGVPSRPRGPEAKAGKILEEQATDPAAVRQVLENPPPDLVPGSKPTTYQLTEDPGLGQLERVAHNRARDIFQAAEETRNQARIQAFEGVQPTGSPEDMASHFRNILRQHNAQVDADYALAQQRAWEEAQALGGGHDPVTYGNIFRRELQNAEQAERASERALWQQIDPDNNLLANVRPIQEIERNIYGRLGPAATESITPRETAISNIIQGYPGLTAFGELTDLRSLVSSTMRQERMANGRTPAYRRLIQLRQGIEDAITSPQMWARDMADVSAVPTPETAQQLQAASAATRERAGKFNIQPIKDVLRREGQEGLYKVQEGSVAGRIVQSGPKGYDSASNYLRAVGNERGLPDLQDAAAASMRRAAVSEREGTVNPKKLSTWMRQHQDLLRAIEERDGGAFSQQLSNAGRATELLDTIAARRAQTAANVADSEFGKLINATDAADISNVIGGIFGSKLGVGKMRDLARLATTPEAEEGLRRGVASWLQNNFINNADAIKADKFQTLIRTKRAVFEAAKFSPEQINNLAAIASDLKRSAKSFQTKVPGGPGTAQDIGLAGTVAGQGASWLGHLVAAKLGMPGVYTAGKAISKVAMAQMRRAGIANVDELVNQAMLHPEIARDLLRKSGELTMPGLKKWALYQGSLLTDEKRGRGFKSGGPVKPFNPASWREMKLPSRDGRLQAGGVADPVLSQQAGQPVDSAGNPVEVQAPAPAPTPLDPSLNVLSGMSASGAELNPQGVGGAFVPGQSTMSAAEAASNPGTELWQPYNNQDVLNLIRQDPLYEGKVFSAASGLRDPRVEAFWANPENSGLEPVAGMLKLMQEIPDAGRGTLLGGIGTFADIYAKGGRPPPAPTYSHWPSTNNWTLLPPEWQTPGYYMRNGAIIDIAKTGREFWPGAPSPMSGATNQQYGGSILGLGPVSYSSWQMPLGEFWPGAVYGGYWNWGGTNSWYQKRGGRVGPKRSGLMG